MGFQKLQMKSFDFLYSNAFPTSDLKVLSLLCWELNERSTPLFLPHLTFWLGSEDLARGATSLTSMLAIASSAIASSAITFRVFSKNLRNGRICSSKWAPRK